MPVDMKQLRTTANDLRNYCGDTPRAGETPDQVFWWEDLNTGESFSTAGLPGAEPADARPLHIELLVSDGCTMAEVPAFDGQHQTQTADAICCAGQLIHDAADEIKRLRATVGTFGDDMEDYIHRMEHALQDVRVERARQVEKWGERPQQRWEFASSVAPPAIRMGHAGRHLENVAHHSMSHAPTWANILSEEVGEALQESMADPDKLRAELVQVAAVAVAAIESIDRKGAGRAPHGSV